MLRKIKLLSICSFSSHVLLTICVPAWVSAHTSPRARGAAPACWRGGRWWRGSGRRSRRGRGTPGPASCCGRRGPPVKTEMLQPYATFPDTTQFYKQVFLLHFLAKFSESVAEMFQDKREPYKLYEC